MAQIKQVGSAYSLQAAYHPRENLHYSAESQIQGIMKGRAIVVNWQMLLNCLSVQKGVSKIHITFSATKSGGTNLHYAIAPRTIAVDSHNHVAGGGDSGSQALIAYPSHPVKVGESWSGTSVISTGTGNAGSVVGATYKFQGIQTQQGKRVASISMQLHGLAQGEGTVIVDANDGSIMVSVMRMEIQTGGTSYPLQLVVKRIK